MLNIANCPLKTVDFPTFSDESDEIYHELTLIARYNNAHKGFIDAEFIQWALDNRISFRVVRWFATDFSCVGDEAVPCFLDGIPTKCFPKRKSERQTKPGCRSRAG